MTQKRGGYDRETETKLMGMAGKGSSFKRSDSEVLKDVLTVLGTDA